jgi:hypothetical protein
MIRLTLRILGLVKTPIFKTFVGCLMYKLNVLASARVVCNMVVCKCEVQPTGSCVLESKFNPNIILF